jgi:hypothetical protein
MSKKNSYKRLFLLDKHFKVRNFLSLKEKKTYFEHPTFEEDYFYD